MRSHTDRTDFVDAEQLAFFILLGFGELRLICNLNRSKII